MKYILGFVIGLLGTASACFVYDDYFVADNWGFDGVITVMPFLAVIGGIIGMVCNASVSWIPERRRAIYIIVGFVSIFLGIVGAFVPGASCDNDERAAWYHSLRYRIEYGLSGSLLGVTIGMFVGLIVITIWPNILRCRSGEEALLTPDRESVWPPAPSENVSSSCRRISRKARNKQGSRKG